MGRDPEDQAAGALAGNLQFPLLPELTCGLFYHCMTKTAGKVSAGPQWALRGRCEPCSAQAVGRRQAAKLGLILTSPGKGGCRVICPSACCTLHRYVPRFPHIRVQGWHPVLCLPHGGGAVGGAVSPYLVSEPMAWEHQRGLWLGQRGG